MERRDSVLAAGIDAGAFIKQQFNDLLASRDGGVMQGCEAGLENGIGSGAPIDEHPSYLDAAQVRCSLKWSNSGCGGFISIAPALINQLPKRPDVVLLDSFADVELASTIRLLLNRWSLRFILIGGLWMNTPRRSKFSGDDLNGRQLAIPTCRFDEIQLYNGSILLC